MAYGKSILFIGEAVSLAHVARPLVLAQSLDPRQYDIHFACDPCYKSFVSSLPHIKYWPIRSIQGKIFVKAADRGNFVLQKKDIEFYVRQEQELFENIRPCLIVGDLRHTLSISAELSHITYAALANAYWSPYRNLGFNPVPKLPANTISKRILDKIMFWKQRSASASINNVRKKYGLSVLKGYCDLATRGDYTLYTEPPGFIQMLPMPDSHFFIGPVIWSPDNSRPSWWKTWNPDLPLIYITFGSTGAVKWLQEIVRTLQELPVTIVVATAGRTQLKDTGPNVYSADYLPGMELCKLASVVVFNGGSATGYQALNQGTPVVGIWSNIDQYLSMMTIERAGAGVACSVSDYEPQKIRRTVSAMLEGPSYQASAGKIAEKFKSYDACQQFRNFVQKLVG